MVRSEPGSRPRLGCLFLGHEDVLVHARYCPLRGGGTRATPTRLPRLESAVINSIEGGSGYAGLSGNSILIKFESGVSFMEQ